MQGVYRKPFTKAIPEEQLSEGSVTSLLEANVLVFEGYKKRVEKLTEALYRTRKNRDEYKKESEISMQQFLTVARLKNDLRTENYQLKKSIATLEEEAGVKDRRIKELENTLFNLCAEAIRLSKK